MRTIKEIQADEKSLIHYDCSNQTLILEVLLDIRKMLKKLSK